MKRNWLTEELREYWLLSDEQLALVTGKTAANKLGLAALLKFFEIEGCFPESIKEIPGQAVKFLSTVLNVGINFFSRYRLTGRTYERHCAEVRSYFGVRQATVQDAEMAEGWLINKVITGEQTEEHLQECLKGWFREQKLEPPTTARQGRIVRAALRSFETTFFQKIFEKISPVSQQAIDALLEVTPEEREEPIKQTSLFHWLKEDAAGVGLESVLQEISKLERLRTLEVPVSLFEGFSPKFLQQYYANTTTETVWHVRRHPDPVKYTLMGLFGWYRQREITDVLVDLLIQVIHKLNVRAEKKVVKEFVRDIRRVHGKGRLLARIAEVSLEKPEETIRKGIYPLASEEKLKDLVKEYKASGAEYDIHVQTYLRNSYKGHYRKMLPSILKTLTFRSNNNHHQPVIKAVACLKSIQESGRRHLTMEEVPINGVVSDGLMDFVVEKDETGHKKINRVNYELALLQKLRLGLRCKEIWVEGAYRYRNPEEDLPQDFEGKRETYYKELELPLEVDTFLSTIRHEMESALKHLNDTLPQNSKVYLRKNNKKGICLTPLDPQPEPIFLEILKGEVFRRWPLTSLLDVLKETDLRLCFTECFNGMGNREVLDRASLQKRLLLVLYGMGTNTGLKRVLSGGGEIRYDDLLYVKRRFVQKEALRNAITKVANATFQARLPQIWGNATTACASDSKKFGCWDQNLVTEYHMRYRGRGVMVYWHVEKKATCIYSKLKRCSSSEVATMIEGVLQHCTEMSVDKQYVDSHGQSEVGFAFSYLLGFDLMPRLKAIATQKLSLPCAEVKENLPNLEPILSKVINWELIRQQYDQMVKYATALKQGTAEPEDILRRFTRNNLQHPTYKALAELGRAIKTVFLCEYLGSEKLRQEIHEALNVVERWNSVNTFIFFGKNSEITSNQQADQELALLSLHLLQMCMVYVNTLMIQDILAESKWMNRMTDDDLRAVTPLIHSHVNPYGIFELDMQKRLPFGEYRIAA